MQQFKFLFEFDITDNKQTDEMILEELSDRPVEVDAYAQTEQLMDRPSSPLFVPAKTGIDKETQVRNIEMK